MNRYIGINIRTSLGVPPLGVPLLGVPPLGGPLLGVPPLGVPLLGVIKKKVNIQLR